MENRGTSLRRLRYLRAVGAFAGAVVLVISHLISFDPPPVAPSALVLSVVVLFGVSQIWLARKVPADVLVESPQMFQDINRLPAAERVRHIQKNLAGVAILFPLLSYWVVRDLTRLEGGLSEEVRVWWPVSVLYDSLGYWPTVLATPILGGVIVIVWLRKLIDAGGEQ